MNAFRIVTSGVTVRSLVRMLLGSLAVVAVGVGRLAVSITVTLGVPATTMDVVHVSFVLFGDGVSGIREAHPE